MEENILYELNTDEIEYFKKVIHLINPGADVEKLMVYFQQSHNQAIVDKMKTLIWRSEGKVPFDVDYIDLITYRSPILSPNYTLTFSNNYLKYIALVNPQQLFNKKAFNKFYLKQLKNCIFDDDLVDGYFIKDNFEQIYLAIETWTGLNKTWTGLNEIKDDKPKSMEELNWNFNVDGIDMLFGIPINQKNSKHFNDFMLDMWIFIEARKDPS